MMIRIYLLILLILISCSRGKEDQFNQEAPVQWVEYGSPQEMGLDPDSLRNIDDMIKRLTEEGKIPGAAALLAKDGKIIYQTSYGFQDTESRISMDTTDIFRIASMTKPIVSVAILQLYEEGKLDLKDPVSKYIASFGKPMVMTSFQAKDTTWEAKQASREVNIHDLLTHTSGITYGFIDPRYRAIYAKYNIPDLAVASSRTIEEVADSLGKTPLAHEPGEKFTYGLNTDILGRIVEVASGKNLEEYIKENITGPLEMEDTRFFYNQDISERLTSVYIVDPKDSTLKKMEPNDIYDPDYPNSGAKSYFSGGSGMSSTPYDYFIFSQMLLNGGEYKGERILQDSTVRLMSSDKLGNLRWSDNSTFGYGLRVIREKDETGNVGEVVELGWGGAFNTYYFINPKENMIGIIMSQVLMNPYGGELVEGFKDAIERAKMQEEAVEM